MISIVIRKNAFSGIWKHTLPWLNLDLQIIIINSIDSSCLIRALFINIFGDKESTFFYRNHDMRNSIKNLHTQKSEHKRRLFYLFFFKYSALHTSLAALGGLEYLGLGILVSPNAIGFFFSKKSICFYFSRVWPH